MLILDSGVGGLYILKNIKKILPKINYIYMLDNQSFPYGNKKEFFIIQRSIKIINQVQKKYPITTVVIACNTLSTISIEVLRKKFVFPIFGIFPNLVLAQKITKNKVIGLIATEATINSRYMKKIISEYSLNNKIKIIATNKLAKIAEKKIRGLLISQLELEEIFQPWIDLSIKPDTIVLGCTHFSLLKEEIKKILNLSSMIFIDSKKQIIQDIKKYFDLKYINQKIQRNIFLYSKKNKNLKKLMLYLKKYKFEKTKYINLK